MNICLWAWRYSLNWLQWALRYLDFYGSIAIETWPNFQNGNPRFYWELPGVWVPQCFCSMSNGFICLFFALAIFGVFSFSFGRFFGMVISRLMRAASIEGAHGRWCRRNNIWRRSLCFCFLPPPPHPSLLPDLSIKKYIVIFLCISRIAFIYSRFLVSALVGSWNRPKR